MDLSRSLVTFKAGRAQRREGTNWVDPAPTKGLVSIAPGQEDGLLHLYWVNRESNNVEEDLILFPGDASFVPVAEGGRTYVLKFTSSDQRLFFWMQDGDASKDEEHVTKVNNALSDTSEDDEAMEATAEGGDQPASASPTVPIASNAPSTAPVIPPINLPAGTTPEEVALFRSLLQSLGSQGGQRGDFSLSHVLTLANMQPVLNNPALLKDIFPSLPTDLPAAPSAETIRRVMESPPFQASVRQLDQALATGMLQGLAVGLGLPSEAGSSANAFLKAIADQAKKNPQSGSGGPGNNDGMDTT